MVSERTQLEGFATAAEQAERRRANFESGSYTDRQNELNEANAAFENQATEETTAARNEAQKKFDRAESELMQLAEDAARAAY